MNKTFPRVVSILLLTGILTLAFSPQLVNCANSPPDKPFEPGPDNGISGVSTSPALSVNVTDSDGESMDVSFYRIDPQQTPIDNFTIIALPDTQFYSEIYPGIFDNQTQWIVNNAGGRNIIFVTHEGDIVNVNTKAQWENANRSLSKLDEHVPWAVLPGTHDGNPSNLANYATYFNFNRFNGEGWYGGAYLDNNANSYELFSGGNDDYLIFHLQQAPSDSALAWANTTIASHPNRRVIVTTHDYMNVDGTRTSVGEGIWQKFVAPNTDRIFLVLCGHMHGEARRSDIINGHTVYQLLADFQTWTNGGNGWLRILDFRPAEDKIYVKTYSPYLNQYETDSNGNFTLSYDMTGAQLPALIGSDINVPSGAVASVSWAGLNYSTTYSWYAVADDSLAETQSDTWNFTTRTSDPFRGDKAFTASYDGSTRYYWLDMPDNFDNSTPTPLVFFLHGYGGSRYSYSQNYPVLRQIFQTHTWIVSAVECREIGSYDDWYTEPTRQDVADVLNILRQDYDIDSNHIHVMGNSMGGGGSLKMAMFYPETFASLCDIHGITNFTQFYIETTTFKTSLEAVYGGTPSQVPEVYANESALGNEDCFRITPVMIMHGTLDNVVNVSQSRYLNQSLSALGYTVNYVEVPGAGHNMQTVINGREMEIFNWFNDHPLLVSHSLHLNVGWSMVSFPVISSNTSFASIFNSSGYYQVLTWSGTSYITPTTAETGRGYWVLVLSATILNVTGTPLESYELDLPAGWTMIGSIYNCTVDTSLVFPSYYQLVTWDSTHYADSAIIDPGKGYWALVLTPTHITVDESLGVPFEGIVTLTSTDPMLTSPSGDFRWLDVADQAYGVDYRGSYNYSDAVSTVTYSLAGSRLTGLLVARNLKPNFAYQLKLVGTSDSLDNERIGLAGRWWQEEWSGSAWAGGSNLNNKGDGSSPNPNDLTYLSRHLIEDAASPTGYHYRFTGYLVFDYFITDSNGDGTLLFETGDCYHVLWKMSQRSRTADDGPLDTVTFDPDPSQVAYDQDYSSSTVSIFGEWERLPIGEVNLTPGQYDCHILLTEESFHGTAPLAGNWAAVMSAHIIFMIT